MTEGNIRDEVLANAPGCAARVLCRAQGDRMRRALKILPDGEVAARSADRGVWSPARRPLQPSFGRSPLPVPGRDCRDRAHFQHHRRAARRLPLGRVQRARGRGGVQRRRRGGADAQRLYGRDAGGCARRRRSRGQGARQRRAAAARRHSARHQGPVRHQGRGHAPPAAASSRVSNRPTKAPSPPICARRARACSASSTWTSSRWARRTRPALTAR